ncbi:hypothetical protein [Lactovum odontotermitis]
MGGTGVVGYAFVFGGITTIPAFMGPKIVWYVVSLAVCFILGTVLTVVFGFDDSINVENEAANETSAEKSSNAKFLNPIAGQAIELSKAKEGEFILPSAEK